MIYNQICDSTKSKSFSFMTNILECKNIESNDPKPQLYICSHKVKKQKSVVLKSHKI